jgi:ArsR family transcriptional regulator, virulence genes transcriptional regulator
MRKIRASMEDVDRMAKSVSRASAFLKSPANPSRLPILCHLAEGGMSVSEFEDVLELRQQTLSQQLARLREDALGKIIYCRLRIQRGHRAVVRAAPRGLGDDQRVDRRAE